MKAAIDIGSNTVRMLLGEVSGNQVLSSRYYRQITRLGGDYDPAQGLSVAACERTLDALAEFSRVIAKGRPTSVRVVATEVVRRAGNGPHFVAEVLARTGLTVEIIDGDEEALLSSCGVLLALNPRPQSALIFDIGGGSTEFILTAGGERRWQKSYPLGVIALAEGRENRKNIESVLREFADDLQGVGYAALISDPGCELVGTAGTVTTLAAIDLAMQEYDGLRINNYLLPLASLLSWHQRLLPLSAPEREVLPGVEKGRGDLILPGLDIVLALLKLTGKDRLRASDFGLLEGLLLSLD